MSIAYGLDPMARPARSGRGSPAWTRAISAALLATSPSAATTRPAAASTCRSICSAVANGSLLPDPQQAVEHVHALVVEAEELGRPRCTRSPANSLPKVGQMGLHRVEAPRPAHVARVDADQAQQRVASRPRTAAGSGSRARGRCSRSSRRDLAARGAGAAHAGAVGPPLAPTASSRSPSQRAKVSRRRRRLAPAGPEGPRPGSRRAALELADRRPPRLRVGLRRQLVDQRVGQLGHVDQLGPGRFRAPARTAPGNAACPPRRRRCGRSGRCP